MKRVITVVTIAALLFGGAALAFATGSEEVAGSSDPLIWYVPGGNGYPYNETEEAAVYEAFNAMTEEALGVTVDIRTQGAFGEYRDTMPLILASGEDMDLLWTANWSNDFLQNAFDGFLAGLDDLLVEYGQDILADTAEQLEATRVNGEIRAVWSQQIAVYNTQITVNMDLVEEYGWDFESVQTFEDVVPFLQDVVQNEPEFIPYGPKENPWGLIWPYYGITGPGVLGSVLGMYAEDESRTIFNLIESDEYRQWAELMYEWNQAGYVPQDGLTYTTDQWRQLQNQARLAMFHHNTYNPQNAEIERAGTLYKAFRIGDGYTITGNIINTLQAIHSQSERKEDAMRLLNFLWTDSDAYNTLVWGLEGRHYERTGPNRITPIQDSGYYTNIPWMWGNTFHGYLLSHQDDGLFEEVADLNASSLKVPSLGFNPNLDEIKTLVATVTAVKDQYETQVGGGYIDPAVGIPQYVEALQQAGIDELIELLQAQIDGWAAANR